jgi:hypothetical protein
MENGVRVRCISMKLYKKDSICSRDRIAYWFVNCAYSAYVKLFLPSSHKDYCFNYLNKFSINNIDNVFAYMYALGKENKQILVKEFDPNRIDPKEGLKRQE